jgi:hypothetical protein
MQTPPWQLCEQHSVPAAQLSPRFLQVDPGMEAQAPPVQVPEQHSGAAPQGAPICLQVVWVHLPPTHCSEQHSVGRVQAAPTSLHRMKSPQIGVPPWGAKQTPEQHGGAWPGVQATPVSMQGVVLSPEPSGFPFEELLQPPTPRRIATATTESLWILNMSHSFLL